VAEHRSFRPSDRSALASDIAFGMGRSHSTEVETRIASEVLVSDWLVEHDRGMRAEALRRAANELVPPSPGIAGLAAAADPMSKERVVREWLLTEAARIEAGA
jgi:hypothetical protein